MSRDLRAGVGGFAPQTAGQAGRAGTSGRPVVTCEPAVRFGYPTVRGVATDAVAGMVWAGEPVHVVADEFGLPHRGWVLVACWFEARHGKPRTGYRRVWRDWAERTGRAMWRAGPVDYDTIPDPPSKEEVASGA